ncbi:hypothetical protein BIW11_00265 [Tropilaelaps mercedesae]|uniref:Uncharacterized protein n=1 Tax=Tropilaelaps mercedesae TaxID=418985 RepID=A0A1V9XYU8_9ACAR|nr:hypothetical protein BIW11_00265 [Tropilaelaps mercedesae]
MPCGSSLSSLWSSHVLFGDREEILSCSSRTCIKWIFITLPSSLDNGAHQGAASSGQGSASYDHGVQSSKNFGNKKIIGHQRNYAYPADKACNQGAGSFSYYEGFSNAAQLNSKLGNHFQEIGGLTGNTPIVLAVPRLSILIVRAGVLSSSSGNYQQGSLANGRAQDRSFSCNQGTSSVKASGNKETFEGSLSTNP